MASELYNTIDALSREKGIDPQIVVSAVEDAIVVATRKYYKTQENLRAQLDKETGKIRAFAVKTVVETPDQIEELLRTSRLGDPQNERADGTSRWKMHGRSIPMSRSVANCRFPRRRKAFLDELPLNSPNR